MVHEASLLSNWRQRTVTFIPQVPPKLTENKQWTVITNGPGARYRAAAEAGVFWAWPLTTIPITPHYNTTAFPLLLGARLQPTTQHNKSGRTYTMGESPAAARHLFRKR